MIVIVFSSLDGVVEDPDGSDGTPFGGWAMRFGREAIGGDKFALGSIIEDGVLLFGRRTWLHFAELWPPRQDPFSRRMNAARKAVLSHRDLDVDHWPGSELARTPLAEWVRTTTADRDVVLIGSLGVAQELIGHDLVDEFRILTLPIMVGAGARLTDEPLLLEPVDVTVTPPTVLTVLRPAPA